ncbi:hypothetical protein [endosymbiont 'TC1' of Trimyema compressum]|uniref:hypothetical protein n=1 Tax=endosymbiont 'TC1' of Trimyema compressum TaxID=243899 RepID=UPI0013921FAB|nr:hypothetical protein [endosymbiont 'TC1' of Trimyema compressum]
MNQYLIIYSGGTISMEAGSDGGTVNKKAFQKKLQQYLARKKFTATILPIKKM